MGTQSDDFEILASFGRWADWRAYPLVAGKAAAATTTLLGLEIPAAESTDS